VIVLSGPAFLEDQDSDAPVNLPVDLDYRIFYIRYHGLPAPPQDDLERALWRQSDNVPFEQSRNVPLTTPGLGDARRTTTDDASR
jgi:hypothetical protein